MRCLLLAVGFGFAASALGACGNGEQDARTIRRSNTGGSNTGGNSAGGNSTGTGGNSAGAGGGPVTAGGGMAGSASMPPMSDAGMGAAGSGSGGVSGEFTYPTGCPVPNPVGIPNQKFAIQS